MKARPTGSPGEVVFEVNRQDEAFLAVAPSPFRLQKILVPIDFSICSKKALQYALPLANQHGAALTLLHVMPTPIYGAGEFSLVDYVSLEAETRAGSQRELNDIAAEEVHDAVPSDALVRTGSPALEIVKAAKSLPADLIIISTHGRSGLKHAFLGSVAEHVVRRSPCPVLVVREQEHEFLAT